jgi:hypothetical protein
MFLGVEEVVADVVRVDGQILLVLVDVLPLQGREFVQDVQDGSV